MITKNNDNKILVFDGEKIKGAVQVFTPQVLTALGSSVAGVLTKGEKVLVMCAADGSAHISLAVISGLLAAGATVVDCQSGFKSLLGFGVYHQKASLGVFINNTNDNITVEFCDCFGRDLPEQIYDRIKQSYLSSRHRFVQCSQPASKLYLEKDYVESCVTNISGLKVHIECENSHIKALVTDIFVKSGAQIYPYEALGCVTVILDKFARRLSLRDEAMQLFSCQQASTAVLYALLELGAGQVAYSFDMPTAFDRMCAQKGVEFYKVYCLKAETDLQARKLSAENSAMFDAIKGAVTLCALLAKKGIRLESLRKKLCTDTRKSYNIWIPASRKEYVLYKLGKKTGAVQQDGVLFDKYGASVLIAPCLTGGIKLMVEAADSEIADELCSFYKREIYRLADSAEDKV